MSLAAVILVLASAITHTTWNSMSKNINATCKTLFVANILFVLFSIPFIILFKEYLFIYKSFWLLGIITGISNGLAFWGLYAAYRAGELSFVYPLKNALPIIFSTIFGFFIGKISEISYIAYIGFILIIIGCILLPIENKNQISKKTFFTKSVMFTALAALGTSVYSNVDNTIIHNIHNLAPKMTNLEIGVMYIPYMALTTALGIIPFMIIDAKFYKINYKMEKNNPFMLLIMSIFINIGYMLVFIAYGLTENVNYIVAFRQTGIILTMLVGFLFFKEKLYLCKIIGGLLILFGLILTAVF